jgi:hypothetical protein
MADGARRILIPCSSRASPCCGSQTCIRKCGVDARAVPGTAASSEGVRRIVIKADGVVDWSIGEKFDDRAHGPKLYPISLPSDCVSSG